MYSAREYRRGVFGPKPIYPKHPEDSHPMQPFVPVAHGIKALLKCSDL